MSRIDVGKWRGNPGGMRRLVRVGLVVVAVAATTNCIRMEMYNQPRYKTLKASTFFADGKSARELPKGTVPRGFLRDDRLLYAGMSGDSLTRVFPMPVTRQVLERGHERYNIYCTPCHDYVGNGRGMVVQRGFKQPPSFHQDRLRIAPVGYLFDVVTNGFATMSGYASQIPVEDRWAIVAYFRALQLSQNVHLADLSPADRAAFDAALHPAPETPAPEGHH
jgi:hypothetical protein